MAKIIVSQCLVRTIYLEEQAVGILDRVRSTPLPFLHAFPSINTIQPLAISCIFPFLLSPLLHIPPPLLLQKHTTLSPLILFHPLLPTTSIACIVYLFNTCPSCGTWRLPLPLPFLSPNLDNRRVAHIFALFLVESSVTSTTWSSGTASSSLTLCSMVCCNTLFSLARKWGTAANLKQHPIRPLQTGVPWLRFGRYGC